MSTRTYPGAVWCDTVWTPDGFVLVMATGPRPSLTIVALLNPGPNEVELWRSVAPDSVLFLRCALNWATYWESGLLSAIEVVGQGDAGLTYFDGRVWHAHDYPCYGQNGVALGWDGTQMVLFVADTKNQRNYGRITNYDDDNGYDDFPVPINDGSTSQWWLDVFPNVDPALDDLVWTDTNRYIDNGIVRLTLPVKRAGLWIGQGETDILGLTPNGDAFTALVGGGFEPHLAVNDAGTRWAACARQIGQCAYNEFPPFDPVAVTPPVTPPLVIVVPPVVIPPTPPAPIPPIIPVTPVPVPPVASIPTPRLPRPLPMPTTPETREQADTRLACLIAFAFGFKLGAAALADMKQSAHEAIDAHGMDCSEYNALLKHAERKGLA